ncbi:hypothetical protein THAOC_08134, partial [Thalassiosira oceanica]
MPSSVPSARDDSSRSEEDGLAEVNERRSEEDEEDRESSDEPNEGMVAEPTAGMSYLFRQEGEGSRRGTIILRTDESTFTVAFTLDEVTLLPGPGGVKTSVRFYEEVHADMIVQNSERGSPEITLSSLEFGLSVQNPLYCVVKWVKKGKIYPLYATVTGTNEEFVYVQYYQSGKKEPAGKISRLNPEDILYVNFPSLEEMDPPNQGGGSKRGASEPGERNTLSREQQRIGEKKGSKMKKIAAKAASAVRKIGSRGGSTSEPGDGADPASAAEEMDDTQLDETPKESEDSPASRDSLYLDGSGDDEPA